MDRVIWDSEWSEAIGGFYPPKYETNIIRLIDRQHLLSFSWKCIDRDSDGKIHFEGVNTQSEKQLVEKVWELFNDTNIIIAHNGKKFDTPMIQTLFALYGFGTPSPFKEADTLLVARKQFKYSGGNSLEELARFFGIEGKVPHDKDLFWRCHNDHKHPDWKRMLKPYNMQDVATLEKIYNKLLPWFTNHPNMNMFEGTVLNCKNCGSSNRHKRGLGAKINGTFQLYRCVDCGTQIWGEQIEKLKVIGR